MTDPQRTDMEKSGSGEHERAKRDRSPSFPFISLPRAIDRVRSFEANHKRNAARVALAAQTWGYGPKSSGAQQTIAALKAYGLLEDVGGGDDRKVQLTDLANRILRGTRPGVHDKAIQDAAFRPKLIREYAERWGSDRPSDAHRISELHLDRGFTQEAARNFIKIFDETLSFAQPDMAGKRLDIASDNASDNDAAEINQQNGEAGHGNQTGDERWPSEPIGAGPKRLTERATFPLPEGLVTLEVPSGLSEASYEDLSAWIEVVLRRIKRTAQTT